MSFGISFFLSFQNCRQILNSQNIQAIISDYITNCQSQSPTVINSVMAMSVKLSRHIRGQIRT